MNEGGSSGTGGVIPYPWCEWVGLVGESGTVGVDAVVGVALVEFGSTNVVAEDLFFSMLLGLGWLVFSFGFGVDMAKRDS